MVVKLTRRGQCAADLLWKLGLATATNIGGAISHDGSWTAKTQRLFNNDPDRDKKASNDKLAPNIS